VQPAEIENPIDPEQDVVIRQQLTKRSGNEQLRLPVFLPTQHLDDPSPPATISGSKGSQLPIFFNSPCQQRWRATPTASIADFPGR
jgi:hypothetical protein